MGFKLELVRLKYLILVLIFLSSCAINPGKPEWSVSYVWTSGWGYGSIFTLHSNGKILNSKHNEQCGKTVDSVDLLEIEEQIIKVAKLTPEGTKIEYLDNCADERQSNISITIDEKKRAFKYSQLENCWDRQVPEEVLELWALLTKHTKDIQCGG